MQSLSSLRTSRLGSRSSTACRAATAIPPKVGPHRQWRGIHLSSGKGALHAPATCDLLSALLLARPHSLNGPPLAPANEQFKGVKPSGDRVLVKVDKEEGKTQGGVLLPTVAQNKPTAGAVVALGDCELVKVRGAGAHGMFMSMTAPQSRRARREWAPFERAAGATSGRGARMYGAAAVCFRWRFRVVASPPPHHTPSRIQTCVPTAVRRSRGVLQVRRHRAGHQRQRARAAQGERGFSSCIVWRGLCGK
jgi:hypothetical protein